MSKKMLLIAAAAVFFLAGCGQAKTSANAAKATRTVQTPSGSVKLPAHPKRVVATVYSPELLSLGVNVVGATSMDLQSPWLSQSDTKGIKDLGNTMNAEAILKLKPDLIVTCNEPDVKKLKDIAPVLYIPFGSTGNAYQTLTKFGHWLNRQAQAKKVTRELKTKAQQASSKLTQNGITPSQTTVSLLDMQSNKLYVDGFSWGRGGETLVTLLGFKLNAASQKIQAGTGYKQISTESLPTYAGDWLFFSNTTATANGNDQAIADLKHNPVWQSLPAVKKGHVVSLPFNKMYYSDPYALKGQIKLITTAMLKQN
ncbi:ABC transporter substrate-binding protein [Lacticaseibacillus baoqingensis]|uniref:ABC transporter substrate-binding protein n=1 Tax=Lacticaseibacillus baoqingensis TaxID=2486013 RepID=A0ABW4E5L4_9LACO|nr:ABC transporter substrate-binding protein [Lacticaseibacillus baoqingensis]